MVKVIQVDDSGAETAVVVLDDFTIETLYAGIFDLLRNAASAPPLPVPTNELSREARLRRQRILTRIQG